MCGVAGAIRVADGGDAVDFTATVRRMCDVQAYRGPDDHGVVTLGAAALGSRRLSIIDLSAAGHMPMSDPTERWWITHNGEVYNFADIREELVARGHTFRSSTDTEVILHAYIEWGDACFERFIGMFAFAIYDTRSGEVVLARDRYGKKPLYYSRVGDVVLFASEIKALMTGQRNPRIDQRALVEWFLYRNVDALLPRTLVEGISAVLPGQLVRIGRDGIATSFYYSPTQHVSEAEYRQHMRASPRQIVDRVDALLQDSVRLRLISDVPVGTLLSGGLDSSLITALAARQTRDLTAFHVSVAGYPELDERRYAEQLAGGLGLKFVVHSLTAAEFRKALPYVTYLEDLPLTHPNSTAYHLISRVAREHGVLVVQSGEGADELFGGYSWNYRRRRRLLALDPYLRRIPSRLFSILALPLYAHYGMPVWAHRFRDMLPPTVEFVDRFARADWEEQCERVYGFVDDRVERGVLGAMLADMSDFLAPLLRRLDRTSMGASIECRNPFLDHRLAHVAFNLPLDYKVGKRADKWVLKQVAERYMPTRLVHRKKAGFPLPVDDYLAPLARAEFFAGGFCEDTLELGHRGLERLMDAGGRRLHGMFGLVALEIWGRIYFMGQTVADIEALVAECESRARHRAQ